MADFNTSKIDGNTVAATEWNQFADIDNFITTSGQTPASGDLNQLGIGAARYSSGGQFYTDSGTANAYVLSPISPFRASVDATNGYFNGMTISFRAGNANTGASTININSAGVKNLKKEDGTTDLSTGDIITTTDSTFRYNGTSFVLVRYTNPSTTTSRGLSFLNNPITISNNATDANNDIDVSVGNFQFSDGSGQATLASILVKRLDASWTAGTNQGGLFSGTKANSSTYHVYAIYNPTTLVVDAGFLLGVAGTAPDPTSVLPSGYTKFRRIGSVLTDSSGNIRTGQFIYLKEGSGYYFEFNSPSLDVNATNQGTSAVNYTIPVPLGIVAVAFMNISAVRGGTAVSMYLSNPNTTDLAPSTSVAPLGQVYLGSNDLDRMQPLEITTNISGQIRTRWSFSDASINMKISITKFFDKI